MLFPVSLRAGPGGELNKKRGCVKIGTSSFYIFLFLLILPDFAAGRKLL